MSVVIILSQNLIDMKGQTLDHVRSNCLVSIELSRLFVMPAELSTWLINEPCLNKTRLYNHRSQSEA